MTQDWTLREAIEYYQRQGAPGDQGMLVALLREVQEERGGVLPAADVAEIAAAYGLKDTFLTAVIKRYPGLRPQEAPHLLELCGGPRCSSRDAARLAVLRPEESMPGWAFRFLQGVPGVTMVLSGMSSLEQLRANLDTFETDKPLTDAERSALLDIAGGMVNGQVLPCTACRYCVDHCPKGLDIPKLLEIGRASCRERV